MVAVVGYKIAVEHAPIDLPPVWGLVLGFAIGGLLFGLAGIVLLFMRWPFRRRNAAR